MLQVLVNNVTLPYIEVMAVLINFYPIVFTFLESAYIICIYLLFHTFGTFCSLYPTLACSLCCSAWIMNYH